MYGRTCWKVVVTTNGSSCNHKEADTRMLLHARDALLNGSKQLIRTNYSDVLVAYLLFLQLHSYSGDKSAGLRFEQDHIFDILQLIKLQDSLDQNKICYSSSILCFDRFGHHVCVLWSGGKKNAWDVWKQYQRWTLHWRYSLGLKWI